MTVKIDRTRKIVNLEIPEDAEELVKLLNRKEKAFAENLVFNLMSLPDAYAASGMMRANTKKKSVRSRAFVKSREPHVAAYIDYLRNKAKVSMDEVTAEYRKIIFGEECEKMSDKLTALRDYSKLQGWVQEAGNAGANDSKLLDVLSEAVKAIPRQERMKDITPRWNPVDVEFDAEECKQKR